MEEVIFFFFLFFFSLTNLKYLYVLSVKTIEYNFVKTIQFHLWVLTDSWNTFKEFRFWEIKERKKNSIYIELKERKRKIDKNDFLLSLLDNLVSFFHSFEKILGSGRKEGIWKILRSFHKYHSTRIISARIHLHKRFFKLDSFHPFVVDPLIPSSLFA